MRPSAVPIHEENYLIHEVNYLPVAQEANCLIYEVNLITRGQ
jgi:hypothetical protein